MEPTGVFEYSYVRLLLGLALLTAPCLRQSVAVRGQNFR